MWYLNRCIACLSVVVLAGCGGGGPTGVDVSGTITLDGKPLAGAEVHFVTDTFEGYGRTDEDGHYQLVNGAAPGQNKIYFLKVEEGKLAGEIDMSIEGMDEGQLEAMAEADGMNASDVGPKSLIPDDYTDPDNTKLTFPVPDGGTDQANFKL